MERGQRRPAESHGEVDLGSSCAAIGVPAEPQVVWLDLPNGRRARIDLSIPAIRWGIELDLHPDHLLLGGTARDKRRDRQCHLIGWEIERVTDLDLLDLDGLLAELQSLYLARLRPRAPPDAECRPSRYVLVRVAGAVRPCASDSEQHVGLGPNVGDSDRRWDSDRLGGGVTSDRGGLRAIGRHPLRRID